MGHDSMPAVILYQHATTEASVLGYGAARAPHDSARIVRRSAPHGLEIG
jgi:hypothetical protein